MWHLTPDRLTAALAEWRARVLWQLIDRDRAYGAQCWDLSADWAEAAVGIVPRDFWTSPAPGPDQYAASSMWLYYPTHPAMEEGLQQIGRHDTILPGDILVWARSRAYPGSHTAVALERTDPATGSIYCMTQNPGAARPERLTLAGYLGALRPRTVTPPPPPAPVPEEPTIGEIMAFKSVGIGYRPNEKEDRLISVGLDFESGQKTEAIVDKSYGTSWYGGLTEGGFKILTKGHYDQVLREFDAAVAEKRAHELALARASAGIAS